MDEESFLLLAKTIINGMTEVAIKHAELPLDTITVQFADGDKLKNV